MSVFKSLWLVFFINFCLVFNAACSDKTNESLKKAEQYYKQRDYQQAMQWWLTAADNGDVQAMYNVGNLYAKGEGVESSYRQAMQWWLKAADKGHIDSMLMIGTYYYLSTEYPEAVQWYLKAADKGSPSAMLRLGSLYKEGLGVKQDKEQSEFWYKRAEEALKLRKIQ